MAEHKLQLLLDTPEEKGLFQFNVYAATLARAIADSDPHLTIGVFGEWGRGKTTLLGMIEAALKTETHVAVVRFDAWRYQHEEHMLLPLLETMQQTLKAKHGFFRKLGEELAPFAFAFASGIKLKGGFVEFDTSEALDKAKAEEARSIYYGWISKLKKAVEDARKDDPNARVVVLIDDLDRCLPDKAVQVLEAVKVMLDVEGFVFVLALDRDIIESAVEKHYEQYQQAEGAESFGRQYIKKLVQVEFSLPGIREQEVKEYVAAPQEKLGQGDDALTQALAAVVPHVAGDNPREVKRFINAAIISSTIASGAGVNVPVAAQVAFMALRFLWRGFANALARERELLIGVRWYLNHKHDDDDKLGPDQFQLRQAQERLLEQNTGLEDFLSDEDAGYVLLELSDKLLSQLVFYAGLTEQTTAPSSFLDEMAVKVARGVEIAARVARGESLARADLRGAILMRADLRGANFEEANLEGADLERANLVGANLTGANLEEANLEETDLSRASLAGASLRNANFAVANLQGADLANAQMFGASIDDKAFRALRGTNWREAKWDEQIRETIEAVLRALG